MNIRDQLEDLQDRLGALRTRAGDFRDQVEYLKDMVAEMNGAREDGDREAAGAFFNECLETIEALSTTGLLESIEAAMDILE